MSKSNKQFLCLFVTFSRSIAAFGIFAHVFVQYHDEKVDTSLEGEIEARVR